MQSYWILRFIHIIITADPLYFERNGLYIGEGTAMMSRAGMFRVSEGVAVDMSHRVFNLPSFRGIVQSLHNIRSLFAPQTQLIVPLDIYGFFSFNTD